MERALCLLMSLLLLLVSCKAPETVAMKPGRAVGFLLPDHHPVQYRMITSADPYAAGVVIHWDTEAPQCLLMRPDGTFLETHGLQLSLGHWYLNRPHSFLAMVYETEYDQPVTAANPTQDFRIRLDQYGGDTLRLARQGRHGWVVYTYIKEVENPASH